MNKFKEIIEMKKQKSSSRKPRYGTRKLSIGLVSCVLGYAMLVSPTVSLADEASNEQAVATEEKVNPDQEEETEDKEDKENKEEVVDTVEKGEVEETQAEDETPASEEAPVEEDTTKEEKIEEVATEAVEKAENETPVEEVQEIPSKDEVKEELPSEKEASSEETPEEDAEENSEEEAEKKLVTLDEYNKLQDDEETAEEETQEDDSLALEISEKKLPEAVAKNEETREAKDVSNDVQSKYVALTEEGHETKGTVKPDNGEAIGWEVSFTSPRGTIAGDYFTIDLSDNLSLKGIEPDHENEYPIDINGTVVADGIRTDRSTIKYTFNENINDQRNVVVSVKGFAYIDKTKVPNNTPDEKISIALGDKVDEHTINVEYGEPYYTGNNLNGMSQFTEFDPKTGDFTQVFYINPDSKTITTSNRNWATGKVAMFIDGLTPDKTPSDVKYTKENTKVSIQKLPSGTEVPNAIIENPIKTDEPTMVKTTFRDGGIEITFAENGDDKLRHDNIDSPYIVTVKSTAAPSKTGNNVHSRATLYGDGTKFHIMDNNIVTTVGDTEAKGDKIGYFKEHHVYYTKVDGVLQEDKTFSLHSNKTEGHDYDKYFTSKNIIDDFKFIKVDTDKLVENPVYNEDGNIARGNYEPGKTKEVTYIYERDITSGKFQEHHIYQTVDEKGNVLTTDDTVDKAETKGINEDSYKTSKIDRDDYTLTKVKATNAESAELGVKFDSKGAETTGNYVNGKKLEVTYIYQKTEEQAGNFQEHHIYITKDQDGVETGRKEEDGKLQEGKKEETYKTGKVEKDGFEFVRTETPVNEPTFDEKGAEKTGNYKPGVKQEITYVYEKTVKSEKPVVEKGSFQEHHVYEVYKDGKLVETSEITMKTTEGTSDEYFTTSAKPNGTKDQPKEGFTLVKELIAKTLDVKSHLTGEEVEEHYQNGKKLQVRYVYRKDITTPTTPSEPEEPTVPSTPDEPTVPSTPEEPTVPSTPEEPTVPSTPDEPTVPSTPEEPEDTTPLIPLTLADPIDKAREVIEREENNRNEVKVPGHKKSDNPKTGVASSLGVMGTLAASALAFLGLNDKKRKNK